MKIQSSRSAPFAVLLAAAVLLAPCGPTRAEDSAPAASFEQAPKAPQAGHAAKKKKKAKPAAGGAGKAAGRPDKAAPAPAPAKPPEWKCDRLTTACTASIPVKSGTVEGSCSSDPVMPGWVGKIGGKVVSFGGDNGGKGSCMAAVEAAAKEKPGK